MPMVSRGNGEFKKLRPLISGVTQCGKTFSLRTFIYGNYDYWGEEREEAIEYAAGRHMVILSVPGETGYKALPPDTDNISCFYEETVPGTDIASGEYSASIIEDFNKLYKECEKNKPDILFIDGGHVLYDHLFNKGTNGEWLNGTDMSINPKTGLATDKYRAARAHDTAQKVFINYLGMYYSSPIPILGMTVWEDWKGSQSESERAAGIEAARYLWPAVAGAMSIKMPGKFDARLSARLEKRCIHNCDKSKRGEEHYVWQFWNKNDVRGVGVKGLTMTPGMIDRPWIHQSYPALQALMRRV